MSENNSQRNDHSINNSEQRTDHSVDYYTDQRPDNDISKFTDQRIDNFVDDFPVQPNDNDVYGSEKNEPVIPSVGDNKNKPSKAKKVIFSIAALLILAIAICTAYYFGTMKSDKGDINNGIPQNDIAAETSYNYEEIISPEFTETNTEPDLFATEENKTTDTTKNNANQTLPVIQLPPVTEKTTKAATTKKRVRNITFDANGGSPSSTTKEVTEGNSIGFFPSVSRNGYYLDGWYTAPDGGTKISEETKAPSYDCTYYAHWTKSTYKLSFDANGGSNPPPVQSGNTTYTIPSTKPTRQGYKFLGWTTFKFFTIPSYQSGDSITISSDTTLYAVWEANSYTLTYNANGGSNPPSAQSGNTNYFISSTEPTRPGHKFLGWSESRYASSPSYDFGDTITISSDTTLYAVWEVNSYTVSWKTGTGYSVSVKRTSSPNAEAGSGNLSNGDKIYYGDTLSVTYNASTGYTITSKGSTSITVNGNVDSSVIYATAEAKEYTYNIVYKSSNGTNLGSSTATGIYGTTNTISAPSKNGYQTPSSQSVKWDAESKTVTFVYTPKSVAPTTISGNMGGNPTIFTYKATVEYRNRTGNSVQVRLTFSQTIKKNGWSQYKYYAKLTAGGSSKQVLVVPFNTWKNTANQDRTLTKSTDWITVSGISPTTQSISVNVYHWEANANDTNMGSGLNKTFNVAIPTY